MGFLSSGLLPRRFGIIVVLGLALHSLSFVHGVPGAWAQSSQAATEPKRPAYQLGSAGRFNEDWSVLRGVDLDKTDDFWDRLKFIPLSPDQYVWLTIGGQAREREEYYRQYLFGASEPKQSDAYLLSRFRLSADFHVTQYFRMFAEGRSAFALDRELAGGRTSAYVDEFDLMNGFADVMIPFGQRVSVTLRGGRQELIFGSQRLVGAGDFTQVPRAFEGGAAIGQIADWTITPFWAQAVVVDKYRFNKSTSDLELFGVFGTGPLHVLPANIDLYWLDADNRTATFNGTTGRERRHRGFDVHDRSWLHAADPVAVTTRLPRVRLRERRRQARRERRNVQSTLPERPLVPGVYRLHRATERHQPQRRAHHQSDPRAYAFAPAVLFLAGVGS
jgi:hypothetical protein